MAGWSEFQADAPELAKRALTFLNRGKHKTLATPRMDGVTRMER